MRYSFIYIRIFFPHRKTIGVIALMEMLLRCKRCKMFIVVFACVFVCALFSSSPRAYFVIGFWTAE
jgi:hypothetical protein